MNNEIKLEDLCISSRLQKLLGYAQIFSIETLLSYSASDLHKYRGFGDKSVTELMHELSKFNLKLKHSDIYTHPSIRFKNLTTEELIKLTENVDSITSFDKKFLIFECLTRLLKSLKTGESNV